MQALHLCALAVAVHARDAAVDHEADARDRDRGFGDIRREHDTAQIAGLEHAILRRAGQPCVQRQHFGVRRAALLERLVGIADLALAGQEDQDVAARIFAPKLVDGLADRTIET